MEQRNRIEQMFGAQCMIDCINPSIADERAQALIESAGASGAKGNDAAFFAPLAQDLLAQYLLAAAVLGEGAAVVVAWTRTGDPRPWEALERRPDVVPLEWESGRTTLERMPAETRSSVFATLQRALDPTGSGC